MEIFVVWEDFLKHGLQGPILNLLTQNTEGKGPDFFFFVFVFLRLHNPG